MLSAVPARKRTSARVTTRTGDGGETSLFGKGRVRQDGRKVHNMYLFEVKKPSESKGAWDYYKLRATIPAEQAFRPEKDGGCPLVK